MSEQTPRFEQGDSRQFVVTYSSAPSTTPMHMVYQTSGGTLLLVSSVTASTSDSTHYYRFFTMPNSLGRYMSEWVASFTNGAVVDRKLFQVVYQK